MSSVASFLTQSTKEIPYNIIIGLITQITMIKILNNLELMKCRKNIMQENPSLVSIQVLLSWAD